MGRGLGLCLHPVCSELSPHLLSFSFNNRANHASEGQRGHEEEEEAVWEEE